MVKSKQKLLKKAKKRWLRIVAPPLFDSVTLGESLVAEATDLLNRKITINLSVLTGDIKQQNVNVTFTVDNAGNDVANTSITGYEMNPSAIKRFVRRNVDRIDISTVISTSDGKNLRIKPFVLTETQAKGSTLRVLRIQIIAFLTREINKITYEDAVKEILSHRLQSALRKHLKKIYPVKACEIRHYSITTVKPKLSQEIAAALNEEPKAEEEEELPEEEEDPKPKKKAKEEAPEDMISEEALAEVEEAE
jgi:ribosomal protein S3AE